MFAHLLGRHQRQTLSAALLGGLFAWSTSDATAQQPAPKAAGPKRTFTKNVTFSLPIQVDDAIRSSLAEVQLYVKSGSQPWVQHEAVAPTAPYFTCRAPADGEYQFMLVTVDRQGRRTPNDVEGHPASLRVVVDTTAPALEATASVENGHNLVSVKIVDAHPDFDSIQAMVATADGEQRALSPVSGRPGTFIVNPADLSLPIRLSASDMAGNAAARVVTARELGIAAPPAFNTARNEPPPLPKAIPSALLTVPPPPPPPVQPSVRPTPDIPTPPRTFAAPGDSPEHRVEAPRPAPQSRLDVPPAAPPATISHRVADDSPIVHDVRKLTAERDELRAQLALVHREREDLAAKLNERTNEVVELRVQLGVRLQERQQLLRDIQSLTQRFDGGAPHAPAPLPPIQR